MPSPAGKSAKCSDAGGHRTSYGHGNVIVSKQDVGDAQNGHNDVPVARSGSESELGRKDVAIEYIGGGKEGNGQ
jgi:hypothetical protein